MGGAAAGELASAMAADIIHHHLATTWAQDADVSAARFAYRMKEAVELANAQIYAYAREHPDVRGMGTTVTAAGVFGDELYLAQIGDSRGYLIRNGETFQLTRDQSLTQRLVDAGELTEEEAEQSERRNIILQALGPDPRVKVDLSRQTLRRGDTLILCSDGLSGVVKREELAAARGGERGPALALQRADRPGERAGRTGQRHGGGGEVRRRGAAGARLRGRRGLPGLQRRRPGHHRARHRPVARPSGTPESVATAAPPRPPSPPRPRTRRVRTGSLLLAAALIALIALLLSALL